MVEVAVAVPLAVEDPVLTPLPVFAKADPVEATVGAPVGRGLKDPPFIEGVGAPGVAVMTAVLVGEEVVECVLREVSEALGEAEVVKGAVWVRE